MADDSEQDQSQKTEEPTQKKLEDAHKRGDVAKSQEVNSWFVMAGITLMVAVFVQGMAGNLGHSLSGFLANAHAIHLDSGSIQGLWMKAGMTIAAAILLPLVFLAIVAAAGNLVQHRMVWSVDPIKPKTSKISPMSGMKRLFSKESLVNFAKGLAKLTLVAAVMAAIMWPNRDQLDTMITRDPSTLLPLVRDYALQMLVGLLAIVTVIAGLDLLYQRHRWMQKQRMTLKEVKDEFKQTEGDPTVRAKIRQVRMERGRQRMIARIPEATVVVTNPTHYSVALKYEPGMNAPICLGKGVDEVALRIREVAKEAEVPVIRNPPLARALYATVDIDEEIPEEHYRAAAEVIGFVMRNRGKGSWKASKKPR